MSVQITTGEYTQVVVANTKSWAEVRTATEFNLSASAKTEEVRAFNDAGEPLVISTDMGQTTGTISLFRSSTLPFENIAMGLSVTHDKWNLDPTFTQVEDPLFSKFDLKTAIQHPMFFGTNFKDKITNKIFGSQWGIMGFLNSDGTSEAVSGTLANTFNFTATGKYTFPYAIAIGTYAQWTADSANRQVWYKSDDVSHTTPQAYLPGGTDNDGNAILFTYKDGVYTSDATQATLCAWLTKKGTKDEV